MKIFLNKVHSVISSVNSESLVVEHLYNLKLYTVLIPVVEEVLNLST